MSRRVGFVRTIVSPNEVQHAVTALRVSGATDIVVESNPLSNTQLKAVVAHLSRSDELIVTRSSHLASSLTQFVRTVGSLTERGVRFTSLEEAALCTGSIARPTDDVLVALNALRRELISIRTKAGMADAAVQGRRAGRPTVMTEDRIAIARELRRQGRAFAHIARVIGVSPSSVRRGLLDGNG